ncbi:MAG: amidohydrolase, partial [Caldilineaceae bacterium SB0670_bin_27]|nr:amidohydrolase [Caldilineaceae bacterium SB0670_bin_27]
MSKNACEILISNGRVITMDAARTIYTTGAVAVTDSRIVEVGADDELRSKYDAGQTIDAAGAIVHPGFIDAHNHIVHTTCPGVYGNSQEVDSSTIQLADWKA